MSHTDRARRLVCLVSAAGCVAALVGCSPLATAPEGSESILAVFQGPTPGDAAKMALDEYDANNRYTGTMMLAGAEWGGDDVYIALYEDAADDEDPGVRAAGIRALGLHGSPEHAPMIAQALLDEDKDVRADAARALQRLHNEEVVDLLLTRLDPTVENEAAVRAAAADALGQYAEERVLMSLIGALNDASLAVNHNTLKSLTTLTGQNFGLDDAAWLDWVDDAGTQVFAARKAYVYPAFERDKRLVEYLPFIPEPPNESASAPVGMPSGGV